MDDKQLIEGNIIEPEEDPFDGEVADLEIYDGEPDFDGPTDDGDFVERSGAVVVVRNLMSPSTRNWKATLEWYKTHRSTARLGFNPDNMCLKVCRTARGIGALYPTAKVAQDSTPSKYRVSRVRDLRKGMVVYFDDPRDSNRAGHIVTMVGRVKGFKPDSLADCLFDTNSVKAGQIVTVRGDYFQRYWGDRFVFGAKWLNGHELDLYTPPTASKVKQFHRKGEPWDISLLDKAAKDRPGVKAIVHLIEGEVNRLPDSPHMKRVQKFRRTFIDERVLRMDLLDAAVAGGRTGLVKRVRNEIRRLIKSLPEK